VDLRGITNLTKNPEALLQVLVTHDFFPCLILAHTFSMNTSSHIRTQNSSSHSSSFFLFHIHTIPSSSLVSFHDLPWTYSPCLMKDLKSFASINDLLILLKPMRIENKLPSNWFEDENSWAQWDTKNIPSYNQIGWQSSWLMGLEDSSLPLS